MNFCNTPNFSNLKEIEYLNFDAIFVCTPMDFHKGYPILTFKFHSVINQVREIVLNGKYAKVFNFLHHSGQYLSGWYPLKDLKDFYAGKTETGGAGGANRYF